MNILEQIKRNFPSNIRKDSPVFTTIVTAISNQLESAKRYGEEYIASDNIYEMPDELLNKTSKFFSFLDRYTGEARKNYQNRLKAIFVRHGDTRWGTTINIKHVFEDFFSKATIWMLKNTGNIDTDNKILNYAFEDGLDYWTVSGDCQRKTEARFDKKYGVVIKDTGTLLQSITNNNEDKSYSVQENETYESIAKKEYGSVDLADYISDYSDNPEEISGPVKGTTNVIFSRSVAKNESLTIPKGTVVSKGNKNYITKSDATIEADETAVKASGTVVFSRAVADNFDAIIPSGTIVSNGTKQYVTLEEGTIAADITAIKATGNVIFSLASALETDVNIPIGTRISNGTKVYQTIQGGTITAGETSSESIAIEAVDYGSSYNTASNTITTIITQFEQILTVTNPASLINGFNGNNLNSNSVAIEAVDYGSSYNTNVNTITTIISQLSESLAVTNLTALTNGFNGTVFDSGAVEAEAENPGTSYNTNVNTINNIVSELPESLSVTNPIAVSNGYDGDTITIPSRNIWFLHFFLKGDCKVEITDNNGRYWKEQNFYNRDTGKWINGEWVDDIYHETFNTGDIWKGEELRIIADSEVTEINIKFIGVNQGYLDYIRIFPYKNYPTFTVIVQYSGSMIAANMLGLSEGQADTEITPDYANRSYHDNTFVSGIMNTGFATDLYYEILNYLKTVGIKAHIEILNRE